VAFRSSTRLAFASSTTANITVPTGAAVDDIAIVGMYIESTAVITAPSGFTQKTDIATNAATQGRLVVFWKRLTAADTGTYNFSWTGATGRELTCALFSGRITTGDPFSTTPTTNDAGAAGRQTIVPALTALANDDLVGVCGAFAGSGSAFTATSMTVQQGSTGFDCMLATQNAVSAGTTGARTYAYTGGGVGGMKGFLGSLAVNSGLSGSAPVTETTTITAAGNMTASGTASSTTTSTITAAGATSGTGSRTTTTSITAAGGTSGSAPVSTAVGITAAGSLGGGSFTGSGPVTEAVGITATGGTAGAASVSETTTVTVTGGTSGSTSRSTAAAITATGGGAGSAPVTTAVGITAAGSLGSSFSGTGSRSETVNITVAGNMAATGQAPLALGVGITVAGSIFTPTYRFSPPVVEVGINSLIQPLNLYRITQGVSVVRKGGVLRAMRIPSDRDLQAAGTEGTDYFIGGHQYVISAAVAAELTSAGFTVT
jgi:hypothetical protein